MTSPVAQVVTELAQSLIERGWMLATAESCTGGMIAAACTDLAGSSVWFERGFITYSNAASTVAALTAARSPAKCINVLLSCPWTDQPNQTVPTGLSGEPPVGPATPVTATLT